MKIRQFTITALALVVTSLSFSSCEKDWFSRDRLFDGKGIGIRVNTLSAGQMHETKSGTGATLNNVFGSEEDGLVIEEYVSDIADLDALPLTRGTEIKQTTASSGNFNVADRQFMVMAFIDTVKNTGGSDETFHINEFNYPVKYNGSGWEWVLGDDEAPCWRTSTKYSIWSYWPMDADVTSGSRSAVGEPDGGNWATSGNYNTVSFTHVVPKALEAQQDLLFAYNEETRNFKHVDNDDKKKYVYEDKAQTWVDNKANDTDIFDGSEGNPQKRSFNVHFYHALAAVKFELNSTTTGADVHSITLCSTDNTTSHNIITDAGIATSGLCTATGNPASTGDKVTFAWTSLGDKKPLHYEFDSSQSVAGGYTKTGKGVLFMIPQSLSGLKVIVEFSKNGSTQYYTKVVSLPAVTWAAGKYYTYKLSIGEFHVPGEKMAELTDVHIRGLKPDNGTSAFKRPETPMSIKGVTKMGLIISGYGQGTKSEQYVHMYSNAYAADNEVPGVGDGFEFDFTNYTDINATTISFGNGTTETYYNKYIFDSTTNGNTDKDPSSNGVEAYFVFDTNNKDTFFLYFRQDAQDNSGGFHAFLKGLYVLEVKTDPSFPSNFASIDWSAL